MSDLNPNNCEMCDHKKNPDGGHCYMFKDEPDKICYQHTARGSGFAVSLKEVMDFKVK